MARLVATSVALLCCLLLTIPAAVQAASGVDESKMLQSEVVELTEETFDPVLFGDGVDSVPYIVMFYAPWCPHCTRLKPTFGNASVAAHGGEDAPDTKPAARFALYDGTTSMTVPKFHGVSIRGYPTMYYSIRGKMYKYEGSRSALAFANLASLLGVSALRTSGVVDDLSDEAILKSIPGSAAEHLVTYHFALPPQGSAIANSIADAVMTIGATRFGSIPLAALNEEKGKVSSSLPAAYPKAVVTAFQEKKEVCGGPGGILLAVQNEAYPTPDVFCGEWFKPQGDDGSKTQEVSKELVGWFKDTAFPAVTVVDGETWPAMVDRGGVALLAAVDGPVDQKSPAFVAMKAAAQAVSGKKILSNGVAKPIHCGVLDAESQPQFIESVGLSADGIPTVFIVDVKTESGWFPEEDSALTKLFQAAQGKKSQDVWTDAKTTTALKQWLSVVTSGSNSASKYNWYGKIAQVLTKLPPMEWLQNKFGVGDLEFVAISAMIPIIPLLLVLAAWGAPEEEPVAARPRGNLKDAKKKQ